MAGNTKQKFLGVVLVILLGVVIVETATILISEKRQGKQILVKGQSQSFTQQEWNPFQEMTLLRERVNQMIDDSFNRGLTNPSFQAMNEQYAIYEPEVDVLETDKNIIVRGDLPGVEKDKISVEVKNNYLTLKGVRNLSTDVPQSTIGIVRKERRFGTFTKTLFLPAPVDEAHSKATYQNGVLTIDLPKLFPGSKELKISKVPIS